MSLIEQLYEEMRENREARREAEFRADQAEYEIFLRAKYSTQDKKDMLKAGHAMANASGDPSYPIKDKEDLQNAIHAVGRGSADHDDIRRHIIKRAKALGLTSMIPDNWDMTDGSLKDTTQSNSGGGTGETRQDDDGDTKQCPLCGGSGKIMAGHRTCPTCKGEGKVAADYVEEKSDAMVAVVRWIDQVRGGDGPLGDVFNIEHEPGYRSVPEDVEDRVNERREQDLLRQMLELSEEQREEMIAQAPDSDEIRVALASYNDIENAVTNALSQAYGKSGDYYDIYVRDVGDTGDSGHWAVFQSYVDPPGQGAYKVTFNCEDDGSVTFTSNPVPVVSVTTYEPVPQPPAPDLMAMSVARDADMLALEREAEHDAEIRSKVVGTVTTTDGDDVGGDDSDGDGKAAKKAAKAAKKQAKGQ